MSTSLTDEQRLAVGAMLDDITEELCTADCNRHHMCKHDLAALARLELCTGNRVPSYFPTLQRLENLGVITATHVGGAVIYKRK